MIKSILVIFACGLWCIAFVCSAYAAQNRVLVVHSYHSDFSWVQKIDSTIEARFKDTGIVRETFYMDTRRNPGQAWKRKISQKVKRKVAQFNPDIVIAVDDNAQAYFVKDFVNKSPIQFVFCGVNAEPEAYGYPAANVTGILERSYVIQTLHMLSTLMPRIQRVAVVSDDSYSADQVISRIQKMAQKFNRRWRILDYQQPVTFSAWKKTITEMDRNPDIQAFLIPLYHTVRRTGTQVSIEAKEVMQWTLSNTRKPVVGLWPHAVYNGALLSVTVNPEEHGQVASQMALDIASGRKASDIPMRINQDGYVMVNLKNKEHLIFDAGVEIDQVADLVIR